MTSTDRLAAGVIGALLVPAARLNEMKAAFGVANVCAAFATTIDVMMATTVAMRMTPGRENFWIRILIAFILFGFLLLVSICGFPMCWFLRLRFFVSRLDSDFAWNHGKLVPHRAGIVHIMQ
jgi:predicted membrane protein